MQRPDPIAARHLSTSALASRRSAVASLAVGLFFVACGEPGAGLDPGEPALTDAQGGLMDCGPEPTDPCAGGACDTTVPQSQLRVVSASTDAANAALAIDGDPETRWTVVGFPNELVLALGGTYRVTGLHYRETWTPISAFAVHVSMDGSSWGAPVASGALQSWDVSFAGTVGAYLKLTVQDGANGYCFVGELQIDGTPATGPGPQPSCGDGACAGAESCRTCAADCGTCIPSDCSAGAQGQWGRVTPIADGAHPNLYYDQSEIDELRHMVLVQHSPPHLYDRWLGEIRDALAIGPDTWNPNQDNMRAAMSYALEPTDAKAAAIRVALLRFVDAFPSGGGSTGDVWYGTDGWIFSGYSTPWLFDLLQAYHPQMLSAAEHAELVEWFRRTSQLGHAGNWIDEHPPIVKEGKAVGQYANWWSRYLGNGLGAALVSGDQSEVDYWIDSTWPRDQLTYDGSWTPPANSNRFDLAMTLLAVYPSGANYDTYTREGYDDLAHTWSSTDYTWGGYHMAQMDAAIYGAEMAYHNGMRDVFAITDAGNEPALLRHHKRSIASRGETDYQGANTSGHPIVGWDYSLFAAYRRYGDPIVEAATPEVLSFTGPWPGYPEPQQFQGFDMPFGAMEFMGYPRRIAWRPGDAVAPPRCF